MRDRLMDIQLEAERIEKAEKEIRAAAYRRRKERKAAKVAGMSPDARDYYLALEKVLRLLPTTPPKELTEKGFLQIKALCLVICGRLREFEADYSEPVTSGGDDPLLITDYEVIKEEAS